MNKPIKQAIQNEKKRKDILIEELNAHMNEWLSRDELMKATGLSSSQLGEILLCMRECDYKYKIEKRKLKRCMQRCNGPDGYKIEVKDDGKGRTGKVRLVSDKPIISDFTYEDWSIWLILLVLSQEEEVTKEEIKERLKILFHLDLLEDEPDCFNDNSLSSALITMEQEKFIDKSEYIEDNVTEIKYKLSPAAPSIIAFQNDDILDEFLQFADIFESQISQTGDENELLKKIKKMLGENDVFMEQTAFGRSNRINKNQLEQLNNFAKYKYKTKALRVVHDDHKRKERMCLYTILIFYSRDTDAFYGLFRKNKPDGEIVQHRLDHFISIKNSRRNNNIYNNDAEGEKEYHMMFGAGHDGEKHHVKVLFKAYGDTQKGKNKIHVKEQFLELYFSRHPEKWEELNKDITENKTVDELFDNICSKKGEFPRLYKENPRSKNSHYNKYGIPEEYCYFYEDEIIGKWKFMQFIRKFGSSALILEPEDWRMEILNSKQEILDRYQKREV